MTDVAFPFAAGQEGYIRVYVCPAVGASYDAGGGHDRQLVTGEILQGIEKAA